MITRDDNLPEVGKLTEPVVEVQNCSGAFTEHGEVTGVNEQIACGYLYLPVQSMRIANRHNGQTVGAVLRDKFLHLRAHKAQPVQIIGGKILEFVISVRGILQTPVASVMSRMAIGSHVRPIAG